MSILIRIVCLCLIVLFSVISTQAQVKRIDKKFLGRISLENHSYSEAISLFTQVLETDSIDYEALFYRGYAKLMLKDYKGAIVDLSNTIRLNPRKADAYMLLGATYSTIYNYNKAYVHYENAIILDRKNYKAYQNRAITYLNQKKYELALKDCEKALEYNDNLVELYIIKGTILLALKAYDKAKEQFMLVLESHPNHEMALIRLALCNFEHGNKILGYQQIQEAKKKHPKSLYPAMYEAQFSIEDGKYDTALSLLNELLLDRPNNSMILYQKAVVLYSKKEYKQSSQVLKKVSLLNPNHVKVWFLKAQIYNLLEEYNNALDALSKCINIYPRYYKAYQMQAEIFSKQGKIEQAYAAEKIAKQIINNFRYSSNQDLNEQKIVLERLSHFNEIESDEDFSYLNTNNYQLHDIFMITTVSNIEKQHYHDFKRLNKSFVVPLQSASLYLQQIQSPNYIKTFFVLQDTDSKSFKYLKKGLNQISAGDIELSLFSFNDAIKEDSTNYLAYFCRSNVLAAYILKRNEPLNTDYSSAIEDLNKALAINPHFLYAYFNRGVLYNNQGKPLEAIEDFSKMISLNPDFSLAYLNRAIIYLNRSDKKSACKDLRKVGEIGVKEVYKYLQIFCND